MPFFSRHAECPVPDEEKAWIERSMLWLVKEFGEDTLCEVEVILPEEKYFPDRFEPTEKSVEKLVGRICDYMRVDPGRVAARLYSEEGIESMDRRRAPLTGPISTKGSAGRYVGADKTGEKAIVAVEIRRLEDPVGLIATIAHELGHVHLLGDKRLTGEEGDHEPLTDLTAIFFGFGVFIANSAFKFNQWQGEMRYGWSSSRQGYLNQPMYGYALSCFAYMRDEEDPKWARHLELNPRTYFKGGLQYMRETGNTTLPVFE